ncbi:MAG: PD-(D/E)XK nuclease-like domain-containing protein, partial [Thermoguttaceae bacterium]|nr:PD-(D/E)XK nuclease-like domain-containing protein [Thermoguttaceae bacterium]
QLAFYRALTREATGETFDVRIIATEKNAPFATATFALDGLDRAEAENESALARLVKSWDEDDFPTYWEVERTLTYDD